nr:glycerol-3-phosphate dehydrogenase, mitochondrial-like [Cherax quadricarinatus]
MALDTLDAAIKACNLTALHQESQTDGLLLEGAHQWTPTMFIRLVQDFGLESEVAKHLAHTYGDRAFSVAKLASLTGKRWPIVGRRLHSEFPYIDAEVRYACREYAASAIDVIARRLRLAFLNAQAAEEALPTIVNIMAEELKWSEREKKVQYSYKPLCIIVVPSNSWASLFVRSVIFYFSHFLTR